MSPNIKTLLLALVAVACSVTAAYYYPWPEAAVQSEVVGQPLFEAYESIKVGKIRVVRFDSEQGDLDQIEIRRLGERWILPDYRNFTATNAAQLSLTVNALLARTVLEERTDQQQDHLKYGVVDPGLYESMPNRSALGTKIILEDANRKVIANLIVGSKVGDGRPNELGEEKHFVSIPGQPSVYVIDFNPQALATEFRDWVDPNLFALGATIPVRLIEVESTRIAPDKLGQQPPDRFYRAGMNVGQVANAIRLNLLSLDIANQQGEFVAAEPSKVVEEQLQIIGNQLGQVFFNNVRKKSETLARQFRTPQADAAEQDFSDLKPLGFVRTGFDNGMHQLASSGGQITVDLENGVLVRMAIGAIATETSGNQLELSQYVIFAAGVDETIISEPDKPTPGPGGEISDDDNRNYLRQVKQRDDGLKAARMIAAELNQRHADWIYLVPDSVITQLRPDLNLASVVVKPTETKPDATDESTDDPAKTGDGDNP